MRLECEMVKCEEFQVLYVRDKAESEEEESEHGHYGPEAPTKHSEPDL